MNNGQRSHQHAVFGEFASRYGGVLGIDEPALNMQLQPWLTQTFAALEKLTHFYEGRANRLGARYTAACGVFNSDDLLGAAAKRPELYCVGCSIGLALRFNVASLLIAAEPSAPSKEVLEWVLGARPEDAVPAAYGRTVASAIQDETAVRAAHRAAFFAVAFVWMHESFHTLAGHTDFTAAALGLDLDEHEVRAADGEYGDLIQALELDADAAALSNLVVTVARAPRFGMGAAPDPTPAGVVGEVGTACILALLALELRRRRQGHNVEIWHPFPRRRIGAARRVLTRLETMQHLPRGAGDALARRLTAMRPKLDGVAGTEIIDSGTDDLALSEDDAKRFDDLARRYRDELEELERASFTPRSA